MTKIGGVEITTGDSNVDARVKQQNDRVQVLYTDFREVFAKNLKAWDKAPWYIRALCKAIYVKAYNDALSTVIEMQAMAAKDKAR